MTSQSPLNLDQMTTMCQACDSEHATPSIVCHCNICHRSFCEECEKSREHKNWHCKSCSVTKEALRLDRMSPYTTPLLSPAFSLSSFGSCNSNYDDIPADMNPQIREYGAEDLDTGQNHSVVGLTRHSGKHENGSLFGDIGMLYSDGKTSSGGARLPMALEEVCSSNSLTLENHQNGNGAGIKFQNGSLEDVQSVRAGDDSDGQENVIDNSPSFATNINTDPLIWIPPEPEDIEDEMESVANNDDDDDYNDGTKWGRPSSLSCLSEDGKSNGYKEERQKAMVEAMNGQFKILVSRFLASEGIPVSDGEDAESWLKIVASLSWEAALLVKPDASEGGGMDPGSYLKVKCIASGARSESQVINGLVFKKNTAHKHMATNLKNPRLLLLKGNLGHSAVGLSSFDSMEEEKDYLKSIIDMTESCHPNLVLVERSVSRDIQESLLAKGITLVYDMKLPRLKRIAQCTGSQIISSADILMRPKLKQCDSFHIEKFVEEHNSSIEGGKRPIKTLMFLEGCPKPLGCTVLLKGAHSDELKKVKQLMQYTVFAAYHLILETSFFADQRALYTDMSAPSYTSVDEQLPAVSHGAAPHSNTYDPEDSIEAVTQAYPFDIPISDGPLEKSFHGVNSDPDAEGSPMLPSFSFDSNSAGDIIMANSQFHDDPNNYEMSQSDASVQLLLPGQRLSSVSASLEKFLGDSLLPLTYESILSYFNFREKALYSQSNDVPVSVSLEALDHAEEENDKSKLEKVDDQTWNGENAVVVSDLTENIEQCGDGASNKVQMQSKETIDNLNDKSKLEKVDDQTWNAEKAVVVSNLTEDMEQCGNGASNEVQMQSKDDTENVLDPHSILVLFSSQCVTKQIVCEQSHLSRIKYYGNFDMSLGRFLQYILLNQKHSCSSCGEPPESHVYCYTHQNGNLTVLVKRLPRESILPGEAEGKIWMWTRCLKCERESGIPKSTRRVVMSSAARGLSFGKFLELSFSSHSATSRLSRCGHSLHRDSLRFFGLGSRVAMFRYSPVEIYAVYKPPPVMEFYSPNGQEWLKREANDVLVKGDIFFMEVANMLQKLKPRYASSLHTKSMHILDSVKEFSDVEEMLMQEKSEFESSLLKVINYCGQPGKTGHEILGFRWLKQELLLKLFIWDRRLHSILLCTRDSDTTVDTTNEERLHGENGVVPGNKHVEKIMLENSSTVMEDPIQVPIDPEESSSCGSHQGEDQGSSIGNSGNTGNQKIDCDVAITEMGCLSRENSSPLMTKDHPTPVLEQDHYTRPSDHSSLLSDKDCENGSIPILDNIKVDPSVSVTRAILGFTEGGADLELIPDEFVVGGGTSVQNQHPDVSRESHNSRVEETESWIWATFSELRGACRKDLHGGSLQKFEFINRYIPTHLSPMHELITQEMNSLHFAVSHSGNIISVSEDDISSIIACALALSEDRYCLTNKTIEGVGKGEAGKTNDNSRSLTSDGFVVSSYWTSTGSLESDGMRSAQSLSSVSSDELSTSGSDGSLSVDRSIVSEDLHPEIPVGSAKVPGKSKYSVVCIHAKQFYALRRRCCPSEMAYISSLSRCRKWDAQGGKSKAFFAKSMDDRLIIKQIKKTEFDSFLKFAPDYFKHISVSFDSGSQTCLAKILGIYQVRQNKGGKDVKADLLVMENLHFGRNFSRIYDLKGAVFSRYVSDSNDPECVLLDQNFVEDMRVSPIYIGGKTKHLLQRAIWNDTSFLTSINVMDYSLLVGVDKQRHELVFGIIDYLRQYTWDKQLETWVKASLVVPKNSLPTVISPKEYKKRFRKFMTKYFLTVPDSWSS